MTMSSLYLIKFHSFILKLNMVPDLFICLNEKYNITHMRHRLMPEFSRDWGGGEAGYYIQLFPKSRDAEPMNPKVHTANHTCRSIMLSNA